jgi:molybdate transport system permease protein
LQQSAIKKGYIMKLNPSHAMLILYLLSSVLVIFAVSIIAYQYIAALGSLEEVIRSIGSSRLISALWLSISSSVAATIIALFCGVPLAYLLATKNFFGKTALETLVIDIPQTFPPAAEGIILLLMLGPSSPLGINLAYTFAALVLAKIFIAGPFVVSFVSRRFIEIKRSGMHLTARSLGASQFQLFTTIYLPLSLNEIAAGAAMCWARAMGELGGSLIFAGAIVGQTETLPIFVATNPNMLIPALAASILATTASAIALFSFKKLANPGEHYGA